LYASVYAAAIIFAVALALILKRVDGEEKMLVGFFGQSFVRYQVDSFKVIPFII